MGRERTPTMRVKPKTFEDLKALNAAIASKEDANIEAAAEKIGLEGLLNPDLMHLARGSHAHPAVLLIATLTMQNGKRPERAYLLLHAYQSILSKKLQAEIAPLGAGHIVIQTINALIEDHKTVDPNLVSPETDIANWFDAIELAVDFEKPNLAESILEGFVSTQPSEAALVSVKYRLTERFSLQNETIDWKSLARCYGIVHDALTKFDQDDLREDLKLHILECCTKAQDWDCVLAFSEFFKKPQYKQVAFYRRAEAHCQKGDYLGSIQAMDEFLAIDCQLIGDKKDHAEDEEIKVDTSEDNTLQRHTDDNFDADLAGKAIAELQSILKPLGKEIFLVSGTLLGFARNKSVLPHDKDIDVGLFGWEDQFEIVDAIHKSGKFKIFMEYLRGERTHQLPVGHYATGMTIDMFFYRQEGSKVVTGVNAPWNYLQRFEFTPFMLREVEFLGAKVSVPFDIDRNLTENFGNWSIPDPDYISHVESPSTMDQGGLVHLLVCRLNLAETLSKKKFTRVPRILNVLAKYRNEPGAMSSELFHRLLDTSETWSEKSNHNRLAS
jgi:hypothetical protein